MSQYPQINVRVDDPFLKRLDEWRRQQPDIPNRPEAVRRLVEIGWSGGAAARETEAPPSPPLSTAPKPRTAKAAKSRKR